jgi:hypothetical protein
MSGNGAGTESSQIVDFSSGNSQVSTFTGMQSGVTSETQAFTGANGSGTETAALFNLTNGTSQEYSFSGLSSGESSVDTFYSGTNASGTQTESLDEFTNGTSQANLFSAGNQYAGTQIYYAANGTESYQASFNTVTGQETQEDIFGGGTTETERLLFASGDPYAADALYFQGKTETQDISYNTSGQELQSVLFGANGQETGADLFNAGSPYAYEKLIFSGGVYASQVDEFNQSTGAETSSAVFNSLSGQETAYYLGGDNNSDRMLADSAGWGATIVSGGYGFYGGYGGYGFAGSASTVQAAIGSNIGSIAQADLAKGDQAGATAAEAGLHQAYETAMSTPTAGTGSSVLEGAKWDSKVVTWSFAGTPGANDSQAGAATDSAYETDLQQAFATWSAASGITFEEVSGSAQSDISVGFGELNTASTGEVGYTAYQAKNGQMAGANIELEDPNQDALVTGPGGQLTYSGTDATLEQVMLHELGHAFGLADNADQNSIMYYDLTSSNRTLDSTDIAGIQSLYSPGSNASSPVSNTSGSQIDQLIQAMASYAPMPAGITTLAAVQHLNAQPMFAAPAH